MKFKARPDQLEGMAKYAMRGEKRCCRRNLSDGFQSCTLGRF
ncbi:MAG: hypothetical protein OEY25_13020 [Candidatus Aminicenantes bacterium]|nr:hypothetical protein [Candidatus Aminicenantes bacterium]MDH5707250.1 hypothetical protein [Candidatus Aminicenantes bacterium]